MAHILQTQTLTTRLGGAAREIAGRLGGLLRREIAPGQRRAARQAEISRPLDERLHVPLLDRAPESALAIQLIASHADLAVTGRWAELLAAIRTADQTRAAAPGGRRLAVLASAGARSDLTAAIDLQDWRLAEAAVARLAAMQTAHPGDYVAAQILAQAHLDLGWARRGAPCEAGEGEETPQGFLGHTAKAERVLEPFDPIEENSPLLAGTRYQLVRGLDEGQALFRDWYQDWSDLDPTSPEPHAAHARHLLPEWYGSAEDLEAEANAAALRTGDVAGSSAYAVFHLAAAEQTGGLATGLNLGLFLRGLIDYHNGTLCQERANIVAGALADLAHGLAMDATPGSMRLRMVMEVLDDHIRDHLREFHLPAWENCKGCIHWTMEQVFREELARGQHIWPGPTGLEARDP